jgi:hypothetical protein
MGYKGDRVMDYIKTREKVELMIKGLECMNDPKSDAEFLNILDFFALQMISRCTYLSAQNKIQQN